MWSRKLREMLLCNVHEPLRQAKIIEAADELTRRGATALIHHPTALETGAPDGQREALKAAERVADALFDSVFERLVRISNLTIIRCS